MLVQTSLANRTSPVLRGKWVMEVLLGTPPPPPPPNVPPLDEHGRSEGRPHADDARAHGDAPRRTRRATRATASWIRSAWRSTTSTSPASGARARTACRSTRAATSTTARRSRRRRSCRRALLKRPVPLVRTFTENLMAYALGRRVEYFDQPTIRAIAQGRRSRTTTRCRRSSWASSRATRSG